MTRTTSPTPKNERHGIFKKDRSCQCRTEPFRRTVSLEHRRLRFSFQINDFKDQHRENRPHCFTPVSGGGGDLVASVFRVKQFFLKNFSSPCRTRRNGGGGYLMKADPRVNRSFEPFQNPKPEGPGRRKPPEKAARPPSCVFNDSTEGAETNRTNPETQGRNPTFPSQPRKNSRPNRAASSPSPSEAAIYVPHRTTATRFQPHPRRF